MKLNGLERYCDRAVKSGATVAKEIKPGSVETAPWVRLKCQFGCNGYGVGYCCPPHTPTYEETRKVIDSYQRALLFHLEAPWATNREKRFRQYLQMLIELEEEMFKDGYYKAFVFLAGPCLLCRTCGKIAGAICNHGDRARPSMESCGIDVFQTARSNGFVIETLREESETRNTFCLMLVD